MVGSKTKNPSAKREQLFYKQKPVFGFDIGHGSMKIIQINPAHSKSGVIGYGSAMFDSSAIKDGEIVDLESVAQAAKDMFTNNIVGDITTRSAAVSLPVTHTFNRVIRLPKLERKDLPEAVRLEAEQYIPMAIDSLYMDFQVISETSDGMDVLVSAAPRHVIDSYVSLFRLLGLDISILEPSILAVTRLVRHTELTDVPTLVVDLGSVTTDLIIYDTTVRVTGTITFGGNTMTDAICKTLNVNEKQANLIKTKYGVEKSKRQEEILTALDPVLARLVSEIKKMIRYYEERGDNIDPKYNTVQQIIILGGGANLPGFSTYLTNSVRVATRLCSTWQNITFDHLQPPHQVENTMYATASGLALIAPREILL